MTGVLDHHKQCCALTQAYKEASGWMCVLPSLEWVVAELYLLPTPSSSHSPLNAGQKCSGAGRRILSAVSPAVWCWQDSRVELREGDVADTCPAGRGEAVTSTSVWCCPSLGPFGPCCWGSFLQEQRVCLAGKCGRDAPTALPGGWAHSERGLCCSQREEPSQPHLSWVPDSHCGAAKRLLGSQPGPCP